MGNGEIGLGRRTLLKAATALLAAPAISRAAGTAVRAQETPALAILYLNGGPAGLFNSADSFLGKRSF
ncbi:MAG: hypothetical protein ACXWK8_09290, partial [Myxococcaceae bacterium]